MRVAEGTDEAETISNIIGGTDENGQYTGMKALLAAQTQEGQMSHVLSHSFASHIMMAGENIIVLQRILGHSDIRVTMRYAHFAPNHLEDAIRCKPLALMAKENGDKVAPQSPVE